MMTLLLLLLQKNTVTCTVLFWLQLREMQCYAIWSHPALDAVVVVVMGGCYNIPYPHRGVCYIDFDKYQ